MNTKVKVLFVVQTLYRAGAERFAYEVDCALDKTKFDVSIFCLEKQNFLWHKFENKYYKEKHQNLGTPIRFIDDFINPLHEQRNRFRYKILKKIIAFNFDQWKRKELIEYLNQFDVIHWMGEYTYLHFLPDFIRNKSLVQPMSAKFQNKDIYKNFNLDIHYNICSIFLEHDLKFELKEFKNYHYIIIPLVMKFHIKDNIWSFPDSSPKKIGIFTRLDRYKPLDPFFYSFQLLLDKFPNCELHVFGAGDPKQEGMIDILERLGIQDKVFFRGHQEDIVQTAIEEKLSLAWFQGYNNDRPAGYAGLDICSSGTPLLCWDFHPSPNKEYDPVYPHYKNLNKFVDKTKDILCNREEAENLSQVQFNNIKEKHNIDNYIGVLEQEYNRIKKQ